MLDSRVTFGTDEACVLLDKRVQHAIPPCDRCKKPDDLSWRAVKRLPRCVVVAEFALRIPTHRPNINLQSLRAPSAVQLAAPVPHHQGRKMGTQEQLEQRRRTVLGPLEEFHKLWRRIVESLSRGLTVIELTLLILARRPYAKLHLPCRF